MAKNVMKHIHFPKIKQVYLTLHQRLQWTQIIWVCPDIWVFSVLDNRHLADICAFCQKCQFEVRKAWNALFLQLKPHEMHCKQPDSAILKIRCGWNYANCEYVLFAYGLLSYSDVKQTRAFVAKRDMSQIRAFSDFFDSDLTQTIAIWLRLYSDICPKKWWLEPLPDSFFSYFLVRNFMI